MTEEFFNPKPKLGISACLLGQKVRYDGGDRRDRFLTDTFGLHVEWIPVCPELEVGMGVPREPVRLVGDVSNSMMIAERSGKDWTSAMQRFASQRVRKLKAASRISTGCAAVTTASDGRTSVAGRGTAFYMARVAHVQDADKNPASCAVGSLRPADTARCRDCRDRVFGTADH